MQELMETAAQLLRYFGGGLLGLLLFYIAVRLYYVARGKSLNHFLPKE